MNNKCYTIVYKHPITSMYDKLLCNVCHETSNRNNFSRHKKGLKHINALEYVSKTLIGSSKDSINDTENDTETDTETDNKYIDPKMYFTLNTLKPDNKHKLLQLYDNIELVDKDYQPILKEFVEKEDIMLDALHVKYMIDNYELWINNLF